MFHLLLKNLTLKKYVKVKNKLKFKKKILNVLDLQSKIMTLKQKIMQWLKVNLVQIYLKLNLKSDKNKKILTHTMLLVAKLFVNLNNQFVNKKLQKNKKKLDKLLHILILK